MFLNRKKYQFYIEHKSVLKSYSRLYCISLHIWESGFECTTIFSNKWRALLSLLFILRAWGWWDTNNFRVSFVWPLCQMMDVSHAWHLTPTYLVSIFRSVMNIISYHIISHYIAWPYYYIFYFYHLFAPFIACTFWLYNSTLTLTLFFAILQSFSPLFFFIERLKKIER